MIKVEIGEKIIYVSKEWNFQVECEVMKVNDLGHPIKLKVVDQKPWLLKYGFFEEDGEIVTFNLDIIFESKN
jgi:hypothetical protein